MGHYNEQYEAQERLEAQAAQGAKRSVLFDLASALKEAQDIPNSREKSIAITHIETAILWLKK